jgi:ABC-2 type transport system permease protein
MPPNRRPQPLLIQLCDLFLMEFSNWRWGWRSLVTTGMVAPIFTILALGLFARDSGPQALAYVLTGNVVLSLMFENLGKMTSRFSFMRATGTLDFYATLPIHRHLLVLATTFSFLVLSLPAVLVTVFFGSYFLQVPLVPHIALLLVVPLATVALSGLGALLGSSLRTPEEAMATSRVLTFVMLALGPVLIPPDRLPPFLLHLGYLSPATYAASALRQALLGPVTGRLLVDLTVLAGFSIVTFWLVDRKMEWRQA